MTTAIVHVLKEYCGGGGGGGGSADFVEFTALAAPYVVTFHLAMGVRLVQSVLLRFGAGGAAGGVPWGWARGTMVREATMAAARTESGGSGGGANDGGGNGAALLAVPLLARVARSWRRGGRRCLGIVGHPTLIGVMLS